MQRCAIDYWRPMAAVAPYVLSYSRYHVADEPGVAVTEPFYASWANLRITVGRRGWSYRIRNRHYPDVPGIALFGATSLLGVGSTEGETAFGIGLSPRGWARLVRQDAADFADRVTAVSALGAIDLAPLAAALRGGSAPAPTCDAFFQAALARTQPEPPIVAELERLLADPAVRTVAQLAELSGASSVHLGRIVPRHFGFTPKRLMRRRRFMAVLMRARELPRGQWAEAIADSDYFDQAHFLRDCQSFLGMSLGQFLAMQTELGAESFRKRAAVLGAPVQPLQVPVGVVEVSPVEVLPPMVPVMEAPRVAA